MQTVRPDIAVQLKCIVTALAIRVLHFLNAPQQLRYHSLSVVTYSTLPKHWRLAGFDIACIVLIELTLFAAEHVSC